MLMPCGPGSVRWRLLPHACCDVCYQTGLPRTPVDLCPPAPPRLLRRRMQNNQLSGTLPASWPAAMPSLQILSLHENRLRGGIPPTWLVPGAFATLEEIYLENNQVGAAPLLLLLLLPTPLPRRCLLN